jgi:hypothetical protein
MAVFICRGDFPRFGVSLDWTFFVRDLLLSVGPLLLWPWKNGKDRRRIRN